MVNGGLAYLSDLIGGPAVKTDDGGETFTQLSLPGWNIANSAAGMAVRCTAAGRCLVVAGSGLNEMAAWRTADAGAHWEGPTRLP